MNKRLTLLLASSAVALAAFADSSVSDVVARQRWPWSETVDIDFTVTGDATDVDFTATWDGQQTPVFLGTAFLASAGQHRFEWCPTNDYAGQTLTGFAVNASVAAAADHKYLVLDLENGGYSFLSAVPEGGWTLDHKSRKMVFARIPAGTYTLGEPESTFEFMYENGYGASASYSTYATIWKQRSVTFTSDWYAGVFKYTKAQHNVVSGTTPGSDCSPQTISYNTLRGTDSPNGINWPQTRYIVDSDSVVAKLRSKSHGALTIDLPQEDMSEAAARAGTTTFWPTGGTVQDSGATLTNILNNIAVWKGNTATTLSAVGVGSKNPNSFGLYDVIGNGIAEFTLDFVTMNNKYNLPRYEPSGGTDPVGSTNTNSEIRRRIIKAPTGNSDGFFTILTCDRRLVDPASASYGVRFAIHLKPLNFGN